MANVHNVPSPSQYGKIWRYAVIAFGVIVAAAVVYWVASSLAARPTSVGTTQQAIDGGAGQTASSAAPTIN